MVVMPVTPKYSFITQTASVTSTMAIREPGIRFDIFGVNIIMASDTIDTAAVIQLTEPILDMYTFHLPMKSAGAASVSVRPKKSGIWVEKIVSAIPAVKPTTIG